MTRLVVAWTCRTGETEPRFATTGDPSLESTPLVIEGGMSVGTPLGRVIALDAATGSERCVLDPGIRRDVPGGSVGGGGLFGEGDCVVAFRLARRQLRMRRSAAPA